MDFKLGQVLPIKTIWDAVRPFLEQAATPCFFPESKLNNNPTLQRLFSYDAPRVPFSSSVEREWFEGELAIQEISYQTGPLTRAIAFLVKPKVVGRPLPAILLFHCHSGMYRWGKEKLLAMKGESADLTIFRKAKYDGESLAKILADKGFLVLVPDAFYFGARALGYEGIDAPVERIDLYRKNSEQIVAKMLFLAGQSWPALIAWEDRVSLDYLCARDDVDCSNIGIMGLSLGGFRSIMLAAQDRRVNAVVTAGWLTTAEDLLTEKIMNHSWTVLPWQMLPDLDFSSIAASAWPAAFLALLCSKDHLFTHDAMRTASDKVEAHYKKLGSSHLVKTEFFNSHHCMTKTMQDKALDWIETFLVKKKSPAV